MSEQRAASSTGGAARRVGRAIVRWRTPLVVLPLVGGLLVAAGLGARLLLRDVPEPRSASAPVTCWDGTQEADGNDCELPRGLAGLRWVFPSFSPRDPGCREAGAERADPQRPLSWTCEVEIAGSPVVLTYRELSDVPSGRSEIRQRYGDAERTVVSAANGDPARYEWRRQLPDARGYELTAMYVAFPYAVEVRAEGPAVRDSALESLVRWRSPSAVRYR